MLHKITVMIINWKTDMHCEFKSDGIPEGKKYDVVSKQKQEEQKKKTTSLFYSVINNVS